MKEKVSECFFSEHSVYKTSMITNIPADQRNTINATPMPPGPLQYRPAFLRSSWFVNWQ